MKFSRIELYQERRGAVIVSFSLLAGSAYRWALPEGGQLSIHIGPSAPLVWFGTFDWVMSIQ